MDAHRIGMEAQIWCGGHGVGASTAFLRWGMHGGLNVDPFMALILAPTAVTCPWWPHRGSKCGIFCALGRRCRQGVQNSTAVRNDLGGCFFKFFYLINRDRDLGHPIIYRLHDLGPV